jgi:hypothetical protein
MFGSATSAADTQRTHTTVLRLKTDSASTLERPVPDLTREGLRGTISIRLAK